MKGPLVLLSGPSCVGKSPLHKALARHFPALAARLKKLVLYTSRPPRPGEVEGVDYYFRPQAVIEAFRGEAGFLVLDVRGDVQALELQQVREVAETALPFFEGNPFVAKALLQAEALADFPKLSVFLSPLGLDELRALLKEPQVDLPELVTELMRRKLLRRLQKRKPWPSLADLETIERRAKSAWQEMQLAPLFDYVLCNHDGEDSDNWEAFYFPLGEARKTLLNFAALLEDEVPPYPETVEHWPPDFLAQNEAGD